MTVAERDLMQLQAAAARATVRAAEVAEYLALVQTAALNVPFSDAQGDKMSNLRRRLWPTVKP